jgi:hydrogenase/urease accessory protein HupE
MGLLGALGLWCASAAAHELRPAFLELAEHETGLVELSWRRPVLPDRRLDLRPAVSPECRPVGPGSAEALPQVLLERRSLDCGPEGLAGRTISVQGLEATLSDVLLRVHLAGGRVHTAVLRGGQTSMTVPREPGRSGIAWTYLTLGVEHILSGADHLLFVLGLLLIVRGALQLAKTVTAFTAAHSLTLALAVLGVVHVPPKPVEATIALSLLFLASELAREPAKGVGLTARRPWLVALSFGLLHGFGFAGALAEVGLPQREIPLALLQFNLGVELGQMLVVVVFLALRRALQGRAARWPAAVRLVPAYGIGSIAAYWCVARVAAFW